MNTISVSLGGLQNTINTMGRKPLGGEKNDGSKKKTGILVETGSSKEGVERIGKR